MTTLSTVPSGTSKPVAISFADAAGTAMTPTSATWSLYDQDGSVVNSRSAVTISGMSSTINITTTSADNVYNAKRSKGVCRRYMLVSAVYTSAYGTGLTLNGWFQWDIEQPLGG